MPRYLVTVNGENFLINTDGKIAKHGFVTFRFVDAPDPSSAENAAVQMVRETQRLRDMVLNEPDDPPTMNVTEIDELDSLAKEHEEKALGFIWYQENPKRWWQFWRIGD